MIRQMKVADVPRLLELGKELIGESPFLPPMNEVKAKRNALMAMSNARMLALVVDDEKDGVVGFLFATIDDYWFGDASYVTDIGFYIRKGYRQAARRMVHELVKWAQRFNVIDVTLAVSSGLDKNGSTAKLYEAAGFIRVGGMWTLPLKEDGGQNE